MELDAARWDRISSLFHEALELPVPERRAYVEKRCGDDVELVDAVVTLLDADAALPAAETRSGTLGPDLARLAADTLGGVTPLMRAVGPYRILRVLGEGGMGVVYLAEREDLGNRVALKVLRDAALSPGRLDRFRREEQTLASLVHPSIARLYDADALPDGTPYFVMEYVEGLPITEYCRRARSSVAERLRLFREACDAVQHAHRHAVIHRDLKPSNILVTETGPDGRPAVKLLDFGIAKRVAGLEAGSDATRTGLAPMTLAYAAPEQLRALPVGLHTDVYALGVILYELLTDRHPFDLEERTPGQVEAQILESEPPRPSSHARGAPAGSAARPEGRALSRAAWAELDVLCLTAMHREADRRYASVEALLRDLDHFRRGEPLEARPESLGYRAAKFLRRNRRPAAAVAAAAVLLAALAAFHTVRLGEQRDRAQIAASQAERVTDYLIGLFEAGDPYAPGSGELDVRALLERGEQQAAALTEEPAVQATMLEALGRVHLRLSDYERAEPLLRQALALNRQSGDPPAVAGSLTQLAALFRDLGNADSTEVMLREALAIRQRHLPPNHPDLGNNLSDLGVVLNGRGEYAEAEALQRLALRIRRSIDVRPHEELGTTLNRLAISTFQQGRYAEAERYYREALAVNRTVYGAEHVSVTRVLANLGKLYEELGEYAAADSLLSEALRIRRATLGDDHFETAIGLGQLGGMLIRAGDAIRAEQVLRESLAIRERLLEHDHPSIGTTVHSLAQALELLGRDVEAAPLFERAVAIYRQRLGERHRFTGVALANLGYLLGRRGQFEAAGAAFAEGLSILAAVHPAHHQELAHHRSRYGALLTAQARFREAEPVLLEAHGTLESQMGADHDRTRQAEQRVLEFYRARGSPDRAGSSTGRYAP